MVNAFLDNTFFAARMWKRELAILEEIDLMWDLKFRFGSIRTPRNFTLGEGRLLIQIIGDLRPSSYRSW